MDTINCCTRTYKRIQCRFLGNFLISTELRNTVRWLCLHLLHFSESSSCIYCSLHTFVFRIKLENACFRSKVLVSWYIRGLMKIVSDSRQDCQQWDCAYDAINHLIWFRHRARCQGGAASMSSHYSLELFSPSGGFAKFLLMWERQVLLSRPHLQHLAFSKVHIWFSHKLIASLN